MSIIKKIKEFFGKFLLPKSASKHIKVKIKKKRKNIVHKKIRHAKKRIHKHIRKHVHKIKRKIKPKHKQKKPTIKKQEKYKSAFLPVKWLEPKPEEKKEKIIYGIPKHHKHEAELKVAEKSSEIEGKYAKEITDKRVQLKIQEKSTGEEIEGTSKSRHFFFFRSGKKSEKQEEQIQKVKEERKQERLELVLDPEKRKSIKKVLEAIKAKKQKNLIITNLDIILEIINQIGNVRIDYIADALRIDEKKVEELANILENNDLIYIHYPPFGKAELRKVEAK